jgi:hypothetical protein
MRSIHSYSDLSYLGGFVDILDAGIEFSGRQVNHFDFF